MVCLKCSHTRGLFFFTSRVEAECLPGERADTGHRRFVFCPQIGFQVLFGVIELNGEFGMLRW